MRGDSAAVERVMRQPFPCRWCHELVMSHDLQHSLLPGFHYACALRHSLGSIDHLQGTCDGKCGRGHDKDPDGLSRRQAARLVADYVRQQEQPSPGRN